MAYSNRPFTDLWLTEPLNTFRYDDKFDKFIPVDIDAVQFVTGKALTLRGKKEDMVPHPQAWEPPPSDMYLSEYSILQRENNVVIPPPFDKSLYRPGRPAHRFVKPSVVLHSDQSKGDTKKDKSDSSSKTSNIPQHQKINGKNPIDSTVLSSNTEEDIGKSNANPRSASVRRKKRRMERKKGDLTLKEENNKKDHLSPKSITSKRPRSNPDFRYLLSKNERTKPSKLSPAKKHDPSPNSLPLGDAEIANFPRSPKETCGKKEETQSHTPAVLDKLTIENSKSKSQRSSVVTKSSQKNHKKVKKQSQKSTKSESKTEFEAKTSSPTKVLSTNSSSPKTKGKGRKLSRKRSPGITQNERSSIVSHSNSIPGKRKRSSVRKHMKRREDAPSSNTRPRKRFTKALNLNEDLGFQETLSVTESGSKEGHKDTVKPVSAHSTKPTKESRGVGSLKGSFEGEYVKRSLKRSREKRFSDGKSVTDSFQNCRKKAELVPNRKEKSPIRRYKGEASSARSTESRGKKTPNTGGKVTLPIDDSKKVTPVNSDEKTTPEVNKEQSAPLENNAKTSLPVNHEKATPTSHDSKAASKLRHKKISSPKSKAEVAPQVSVDKTAISTSPDNKFEPEASSKNAAPLKTDEKVEHQSTTTVEAVRSPSREMKASTEIIQDQAPPAVVDSKLLRDATNVKTPPLNTKEKVSRSSSCNDLSPKGTSKKACSREGSPKRSLKTVGPPSKPQICLKNTTPLVSTWRKKPYPGTGDNNHDKPESSDKKSLQAKPFHRKTLPVNLSVKKRNKTNRRKREVVNNVYWEYPDLRKTRLPLHRKKIHHAKPTPRQTRRSRKEKRNLPRVTKLPQLRRVPAEPEDFTHAGVHHRRMGDDDLDSSNMHDADRMLQHSDSFQQYIRWTRGGGLLNSEEKSDPWSTRDVIGDSDISFVHNTCLSYKRSEHGEIGDQHGLGRYSSEHQDMLWNRNKRQTSPSTDTNLSRPSLINANGGVKRNRAHGLPIKTRDHFRILPGSPSKPKESPPINLPECSEAYNIYRSSSSASSVQCSTARSPATPRARSPLQQQPRDCSRISKHYVISEESFGDSNAGSVKITLSTELHKHSPLGDGRLHNSLSQDYSLALKKHNNPRDDPVQMIRYSSAFPSFTEVQQNLVFEKSTQRKKKKHNRRRQSVTVFYEYNSKGHRCRKIALPTRRHRFKRRRSRETCNRRSDITRALNILYKRNELPMLYNRSFEPEATPWVSRRHISSTFSEYSRDADCQKDFDDDSEEEPKISMPRGSVEDIKFEGKGAELFNLLRQPLKHDENLQLLAALSKQNEQIKFGLIRKASRPFAVDASTGCDLGSEFRHLSMPRLSSSSSSKNRWIKQRRSKSPSRVV